MAETKKKTVKAAPEKEEKPAKKAVKAEKAPKAEKPVKAEKVEETAPKAEKPVKAEKVEETAPKAEKPAKAAKAAKKEEPKKEEKPLVSEAHAFARDVRVTPRKVRLVVDVVRGKDVTEALAMLKRINRAASTPVAKLIKSCAANATNNFGMEMDKLYVAELQASDGVRMKRFEPRGKGSSSPLIKRTANIRCTVKERK